MEQGENKRLMISVLHHLRGELRSGRLDSEQTEGLEVAIQCLESIYGVHDGLLVEPPLLEIYKAFLITSVINKPDASPEDKANAEKLKTEGNSAMSSGLFNEAIELYTRAISHDAKNAVYYCNRAAAHSKLRNHQQAIVDCKIAIEIDPTYSKAYGRLGLAYCGLDDYSNALTHYKKAFDLEPTNEGYKKNYELAVTKVREGAEQNTENVSSAPRGVPPTAPPNPMDISTLFNNPQLINIASHMLLDPQLQNMMASFMSEGSQGPQGQQANAQQPNNPAAAAADPPLPPGSVPAGNFGDLLMMGHRLAQRMHQENPHFIEELRNTLGTPERNNPPDEQQGPPPPHDKKQ